MVSQRYLVLSSHKNFWVKEKPLLLLGQWCINEINSDDLKKEDFLFAEPYGLEIEQRDVDHAEVCALDNRLFEDFCRVLNATHGVNYKSRYWRILTGQWFRNAISVVFNRVRTLQKCMEVYEPVFTVEPVGESYTLLRPTSNEALWAYSDSKWDGYFCLRILKLIAPSLKYVPWPVEEEYCAAPQSIAIPGPSAKKKLLISAWRVCQKFAQKFARSTDAFVINSYLPLADDIKLQLRLKQFPQIWKSPPIKFEQDSDFAKRRHLTENFKHAGSDAIEKVVRELLFEIIPICYLEGYHHLVSQATKLPWPDNPRFIFTSNNFGTDELFKAWAAERVQLGVKYIVGQHGNNYGTHRYINPSVEEETSDAFITWGWIGMLPQHRRGFNLKISTKTDLRCDPNGKVLLIQVWAGHRTTTWDNSEQFLHYMAQQFAFVKGLTRPAKSLLKIRLHHDWVRLDWKEPERWKEFDPELDLDLGFEGIQDQIRKSRLVIHGYDSTGLLETLALGIPTLAFWQNGLAHLRDEVKDDYQALVDIGIVHLSPDDAAACVNTIWDDVQSWWKEPMRQRVINDFCAKYSRLSKDPSREIMQLLEAVSIQQATHDLVGKECN